jgi:hypothetical protein
MSDTPDIAETVLASERFRELLEAIAVRSLLDDLPLIEPELPPGTIDWNHALLCSSALTCADTEVAVDAALRVIQGCLTDELARPTHRQAAAVLLERLGNRRAVELAERRDLLTAEAWEDAPAPLQLDVIRRRMELTIPLANGEQIAANPFQRDFWTSAAEHGWLSVSAPTSAGKSYIVKRWFEQRAQQTDTFRGVYLVPTRALVDEVGRDLRREFAQQDVAVFVIPWDREIGSHKKEIFVLTQERLHLLQERDAKFAGELLFVDEAQKFGDGARGVLLQHVLDEALRRRPDAQVLFASPSSVNPELLLQGAPACSKPDRVISEMVTVNQNLLWVNASAPDSWTVELVTGGEPKRVGSVKPAVRPKRGQRLALIAAALGGVQPGNVVYVNGAADAEKTASQIAGALQGKVDLAEHPGILALGELVTKTVHRDYKLNAVLANGVAFHYGNMPLILRAEIERLFREEVLLYLVCTSTLLEGVNLPCRSIFARGPTRGANRPMTIPDFWNLAGRAGRWGTEFRGNVVCVDTTNPVWHDVPRERVRQPLRRASDEVLSDLGSLREFIAAESAAAAASEHPLMASVFSFLATRVRQDQPLRSIPGVTLSAKDAKDLEQRIREALAPVQLPVELMARHAGISPVAMQVLLDYFRRHQTPETLPLAVPDTDGSALSYTKALSRSRDYLGTKSFGSDKRCAMLGILVRDWMRGYALARLIAERINYARTRTDTKPAEKPVKGPDTATIIRDTLDDVEQIARFAAPKYLACYHDILGFHLADSDESLSMSTDTLTMMLELGVSQPSEVSMMSLGLSRTSAVALSELAIANDMTPEQALAWLRAHPVERLAVPALVRNEISELLEATSAG